MIGIYKITSPSGKIYVGQSTNIEKRFTDYKKLNCKYQVKIYRSILKYGFENHIFEIICECDVLNLNEKEQFYQELFYCIGKNGLNCKITTSKDKTGYLSEETKLKIKNKALGRNVSKETKEKMSLSHKGKVGVMLGKKHPEEVKIKISNSLKGKKRPFANVEFTKSVEWKEKISKILTGKKRSLETRQKMSLKLIGNNRGANKKMSEFEKNNLKKLFSKIILNTETGVFYLGTKEAAFYNNYNASTLKNRLNGNLKNNTNLIYC